MSVHETRRHTAKRGRHARPRPSNRALATLATLIALWLGLTAPSVSPVTPGPAAVAQSAAPQGAVQP